MKDNIYVVFSCVFVIILFISFSVILHFNIRNDLLINEFKKNDQMLDNLISVIDFNISNIVISGNYSEWSLLSSNPGDFSQFIDATFMEEFQEQNIYSIAQIDSFYIIKFGENDSFMLIGTNSFKKPLPLFNWENIHTEIICYNTNRLLPNEILPKFERYTSINRNYGFFQTSNYIVNYRTSKKGSACDFTTVLYVPKKYIYRQLGDVTLLFTVLLTVMIVFLSIFVLFYVNSLTRIIKLEESTKRERELLRINHLITTEKVSESIVHNINNPLTAARGFLQLFGAKQSSMYETYKLDKVMNNINFVIQQLNTIMEGSRRSLSEEKIVINLTELVNSELDFYRNMIESQNIDIFTQLENNLPSVKGTYGDFKMVFSNLIENAADSMFSSEMKALTIKTSYDDENIYVSVEDTGSGIDDSDKEKIFDLYFTTKSPDKDSTDKPVGTGIGLYSVSMILKKYNASISCDSILGKGTTFTITIPISS